jgi:hypothetical protein
LLVVPVDKSIAPLTPEEPASAVRSVILPLEYVLLWPVVMETDPPVLPSELVVFLIQNSTNRLKYTAVCKVEKALPCRNGNIAASPIGTGSYSDLNVASHTRKGCSRVNR